MAAPSSGRWIGGAAHITKFDTPGWPRTITAAHNTELNFGMGTKSKDWSDRADECQDREDGRDPQIAGRYFVSLCDEIPEPSDEVETPEPDQSALLAAMGPMLDDVLTKQERFVLLHRQIGLTYAYIADVCRPRISSPSQARKIEQRALRKMRVRLSKFRDR